MWPPSILVIWMWLSNVVTSILKCGDKKLNVACKCNNLSVVYLGPIKAETVTQNVAVQLCENARQQFKEIRFFVEHSYSTLKLLCTALPAQIYFHWWWGWTDKLKYCFGGFKGFKGFWDDTLNISVDLDFVLKECLKIKECHFIVKLATSSVIGVQYFYFFFWPPDDRCRVHGCQCQQCNAQPTQATKLRKVTPISLPLLVQTWNVKFWAFCPGRPDRGWPWLPSPDPFPLSFLQQHGHWKNTKFQLCEKGNNWSKRNSENESRMWREGWGRWLGGYPPKKSVVPPVILCKTPVIKNHINTLSTAVHSNVELLRSVEVREEKSYGDKLCRCISVLSWG